MKRTFSTLFLFYCTVSPLFAESVCYDQTNPEIGSSVASASIWSNAFSKSGSLREEAKALLLKGLESNIKSPEACLNKCKGHQPIHTVILTSIPDEAARTQESLKVCEKKVADTKSAALEVGPLSFTNFDQMYSWINDYTQGKGEKGKKLYAACDGGCSPIYTFQVRKNQGNYELSSLASCGYPRDKEKNTYQLKAVHAWSCPTN